MILGMTGFAERNFASPTLRLKIGVKTLNHRYFDWSYKGAPLGEAESRIRALCQKRVRRGRIEVFVDLVSLSPESWNFTLNEGLLEKIMVSLDRVSRRTGRRFEISLDSLFRVPQLVEVDRKALGPKEAAFLEKCFARTLDDVLVLRRREGQETARLLRVHLAAVRRFVRKAEAMFKRLADRYRDSAFSDAGPVGMGFVALARKLAVLMHRIWVTGEVYEDFPSKQISQAA